MAVREKEKLSTQQAKVMALICRFDENNGRPPVVRELADSLGLAVSTIQYTLRQLTEKGYIQRDRHTFPMRILKRVASDQFCEIPICGVINGQLPILFQKPFDKIRLNSALLHKHNIFGVQVDHWPLRIHRVYVDANSLAIFYHRQVPSQGNIVIAMHNGTLRLGQIRMTTSKITLWDGEVDEQKNNIKPTDDFKILAIFLTSFSKNGVDYCLPG